MRHLIISLVVLFFITTSCEKIHFAEPSQYYPVTGVWYVNNAVTYNQDIVADYHNDNMNQDSLWLNTIAPNYLRMINTRGATSLDSVCVGERWVFNSDEDSLTKGGIKYAYEYQFDQYIGGTFQVFTYENGGMNLRTYKILAMPDNGRTMEISGPIQYSGDETSINRQHSRIILIRK